MPDVRIERQLKIPPVPAYGALQEVVRGIASREGPWRGFALHVALGEFHLPDVGYVAIPIQLTAGDPKASTHEMDVTFSAASHAGSFPTFKGSAGVDTTGPSGCIFWIAGTYDVPLQAAGKLFDATVASGVARRSLENLADDLAAACVALVEKREAEYMRYRAYER